MCGLLWELFFTVNQLPDPIYNYFLNETSTTSRNFSWLQFSLLHLEISLLTICANIKRKSLPLLFILNFKCVNCIAIIKILCIFSPKRTQNRIRDTKCAQTVRNVCNSSLTFSFFCSSQGHIIICFIIKNVYHTRGDPIHRKRDEQHIFLINSRGF